MPTYEYACRKCGEHLEAVQAFTDDPLTTCPNCRGELRKVFGAVGIVFKGSGFYKTDNRSNGSRSTVPAADAATGTPSSGSEGSSSTTTSTESGTTKEPAKEAAKATPAAPAKGSTSSSPTPTASTS